MHGAKNTPLKPHLRSGASLSISALLLLSVLVVAAVVVFAPAAYVAPPSGGVISASPAAIDSGGSATLSITTSPSPYEAPTCEWLAMSPGGSYSDLASSDCSSPYTFSTSASTIMGTWSFELQVTVSYYSPVTSNAVTVTVNPALTAPSAPTVSAITPYYIDQIETVTSTIPTTGTPTYSWQWLVEVDGASVYSATTLCAVNSGSGASAGATETCTISAGTLIPTDTYSFELQVTDSASETAASSASPTVTVLGPDQSFTLVGSLTKTTIGSTSVFEANWINNVPSTLNPQITGIVWFEVMNTAGTVMIAATSLTLPSGASAPAYLGLSTLAPGTYTIEAFVSTTNGIALSLSPTDNSVTIP